MLAVVGVIATFAYLFTVNIRRGQSEPQLAAVFEAGADYDYRISRRDLPRILGRRTNVWLILQGFTAQIVFGSLVFLPRLFQAKAQAIGYSQATAIDIGSVYATLFQLGGVPSRSSAGWSATGCAAHPARAGRWWRRSASSPPSRSTWCCSSYRITLDIPDGAGTGELVGRRARSVVAEPAVAVSFVTALLALALTSANSPNWFALITEVNPPEHRGTVFSLGNLVNGVGRAGGNRRRQRHLRRPGPGVAAAAEPGRRAGRVSRSSSFPPASCTGSRRGPPRATSRTCATPWPNAPPRPSPPPPVRLHRRGSRSGVGSRVGELAEEHA